VTDRSNESQFLEELILSAAKGDRAAQNELIQRYWPVIRDAVRATKRRMGERLREREETADLQQAAAIKILAALDAHDFRGRPAFAAWIRRLAQAEVVDHHRHHAAQKRAAPELGGSELDRVPEQNRSPESRYDDQQRFEKLLAGLEELKPEYRTALMLHHMGYSHKEIGDTLDCTPEAARKLITRARTKLVDMQTSKD
jgi:RNA polymerase sigma factor (sigma-70 family)